MRKFRTVAQRAQVYLTKAKKRKKKEFLEEVAWTPFFQPIRSTTGISGIYHGYGDDHRSLAGVQGGLVDLGMTTVSPDFPGHGRSMNGSPWYFRDFLDLELVVRSSAVYLGKTVDRRKLPMFLVGYSMGALAVLSFLINQPIFRRRVAGAVLICPPLEVRQNSAPWVRNMTFALSVLSLTLARQTVPAWLINKNEPEPGEIEQIDITDKPVPEITPPFRVAEQFVSHAKYVQGNLQRLNDVPMLVIHPQEDHRACFHTSKQNFSTLECTTFVPLPTGVPHYMWGTHHENTVVTLICDWMQGRINTHRNS